jgi:hypothetical protein
MKKLIELREQFELILNPEIEYNISVSNYSFDGNWVNETGRRYFDFKQEEFQYFVNENFNYEDKNHVKFLKIRFKQLLDKCEEFNQNEHEDLSYFDNRNWAISVNYPHNPPQTEASKLESPSPENHFDDRNEYILEIIKGLYNLDDESEKYMEEECEDCINQDIIDTIISEKFDSDESCNQHEMIYPKAHLSYVISLYNQMIRNIGIFIEKRINIIEEIESFDDNISNFNSTLLETPNNLSLNFNLSKNHLGHLFYNLYEIDFINRDKTDIEDKRTKLKNYINSANMFYLDNKSNHVRAVKMTRAIKFNRYIKSEEVQDEINFMESLITKLNIRLNTLKEKLENLKIRGH